VLAVFPSDDLADSVQTSKRKRGFILSLEGWQRLQAAEFLFASQDNAGKSYTLEQLGDRTQLSAGTLTKIRRRQKPVDQPSLEAYFAAFGLMLGTDDYIRQTLEPEAPASELTHLLQAPLKGQLALDSPFYIQRSPAERMLNREMRQPGALVRIKAPRQFGKTSLIARGLSQSEEAGFRTTVISLQLADSSVFGSLNQFLRWLCAMVSRHLDLPDRSEEFWNPLLGANYSCNDYFERYILPAAKSPFLLVLDEANRVFNYADIATDFFGMLRAWYEQSRHDLESGEWQKLRLVISYSTDLFVPLHIHQSPFNVGALIELSGFTQEQVQELGLRYRIATAEPYAESLFRLLGGHPYLTQLALFYLSHQRISLEDLLKTAIAPNSIFGSHFKQQLGYLEDYPELKETMRQIVLSPAGIDLYPTVALKLHGMGLIRFQDDVAIASCTLYQSYFAKVLSN
jgi:transcriptional regulator with XRE-family HTH domain